MSARDEPVVDTTLPLVVRVLSVFCVPLVVEVARRLAVVVPPP